ncbi:general transcription and DNA repair factor IIH subunit TFB2-like isoform X2 [Apium graveolens]|uniref:general transcription and DNA repair factor IIH subunit TFB2-like isoform X2 n=1 Tax=Apium graveolens TaxID=4045 RepID=UPI003D79B650
MNAPSNTQGSIVKDLADLGLLKLQQGYVVVETNFRLYAYTTSKLHCEILRLFARQFSLFIILGLFRSECLREQHWQAIVFFTGFHFFFARIEYQLPNLIVGAITKENLCKAFQYGITADQIICFLQQNAHPRVAEKVPSVPENVTDQIRLWESDLNRVEMTPSHLYDEFSSRIQ